MALFKDAYPQVHAQLHPDRNIGIEVDRLNRTSHQILWWTCSVGHEWREPASQRVYPAKWKNGDNTACVLCHCPPGVLFSCGHRLNRPTEATMRIAENDCRKCEADTLARRVLDAMPASTPDAIAALAAAGAFWEFCTEADRTIRWWPQLYPLVEAYFVRMFSLARAYTVVAGSSPTSVGTLVAACSRRIADAFGTTHRAHLQATVIARRDPEGNSHLRDNYLSGNWGFDFGPALRRVGFDIVDTQLDRDINDRIEELEGARLTVSGAGHQALAEPDLFVRGYPAYAAPITPKASPAPMSPHLRQALTSTSIDTQSFSAVRVCLGAEEAAPSNDPLGRPWIGYREGLTAEQLWERGRGVWRWPLDHVAASTILLIVHDRKVVAVGSIAGVMFHGDGLAIVGEPIEKHRLIGAADPLHTTNPLGHGSVRMTKGGRVQALGHWLG